MHVASLELCKELYALSGWRNTDQVYAKNAFGSVSLYVDNHAELGHDLALMAPAYDLGYLLRKLEPWCNELVFSRQLTGEKWCASDIDADIDVYADTPEDATATLCIELINQHILNPIGEKSV